MTTASTRSFAPLKEGAKPERMSGRTFRYLGGAVDWDALLKHPRVVILAEASAGKTWELRRQATALATEGDAAFFVRIDDLADGRLEDGLDADDTERFERWRREGNSDAWFFLDSVDEARLNRKSFDGALRRLGKDLGAALTRARIVISCRASDWRVRDDPALIRRLLPIPAAEPEPATVHDENTVLLDRIFPEKEEAREPIPRDEAKSADIYVVQLLPLDADDQRRIANAQGIVNVDAFMAAIVRSGLHELAERPGDLLSLVANWRDKAAFGSLAEMTAHGIEARLAEPDPYRPDNGALSPEMARDGAERLAAALTFGQAFTLLATGDQADAALAAGALDPRRILPELIDDQRQALVRRGVFAPSTYGRLRFHHRSAQEYLTAAWLRRLHDSGCPLSQIWDLIFAERYGVETVVPSLRAAGAWLALWLPQVRDELIRREPLTLLLYGDPKSLPIPTRAALLAAWAAKGQAAALSHADIDDRALWLFADPALVLALREAWAASDLSDLRTDLLRCIREGRLVDCADLALATALDPRRSDTERIVAADALAEMDDRDGLAKLADLLRQGLPPSFRLAVTVAHSLFPAVLTAEQLVETLGRCELDDERDFSSYLPGIMRDATTEQRRAFAYAVGAALGGVAPDEDDEAAPNHRFTDMLKGCAPLVTDEVNAVAAGAAPPELVALLGAMPPTQAPAKVEREALLAAVANRPALNRAVFWRAADAARDDTFEPRRVFQLNWRGRGGWWSLNEGDLAWLAADLAASPRPTDQELVLDAIIHILRQSERFETDAAWLNALVAPHPALRSTLDGYRTPPPVDPDESQWAARQKRSEAKEKVRIVSAKNAWVRFKDDIKRDREKLTDAAAAAQWDGTGFILDNLARWLVVGHEGVDRSSLRWHDLKEAFGGEVAEAFCIGMMALWRGTAPRRPKYTAENRLTTYTMNELALGGLNLEAARDPAWIGKLSDDDVRRAAQHAAYAEHHFPDWLDALVTARPKITVPVLLTCLNEEWRRKWGRNELLVRYVRSSGDAQAALVAEVLRLVLARNPANPDSLAKAVVILGQGELSPEDRSALLRASRRRWKADLKAGRLARARLQLALMFIADSRVAADTFADWLQRERLDAAVIQGTFSTLFGRDNSALPGPVWAAFSVPVLAQLLRLAYQHIPLKVESRRRGRVVSARDDAEGARNALLSALLDRTGPDAFAALQAMASEPDFGASARRFAELAHGVAERATERPAWTEGETVAFERAHVAPVKSGADLLRLVTALLDEIRHGFTRGDSHSGAALHRLQTEEEVQHWLAEQLNLRSQGRFKASRETEVALGNKPDVVVTSHAAPVEVALEIKHGDKAAWTSNKLRSTLTDQLAEQYLLPDNRRHGVLLVTHHGRRTWQDPATGKAWKFQDLVAWLQTLADAIHENRAGGVEVRMIGLDPGILLEAKPKRPKGAATPVMSP